MGDHMRCVKCNTDYDDTALSGCPKCASVEKVEAFGKGISAIGSLLIWAAVLVFLIPCALSSCSILK